MDPDKWLGAIAANGDKIIDIAEHRGVALLAITFLFMWLWAAREKTRLAGQLIDAYRERAHDAIESERKSGEVIAANTRALMDFAGAIRDISHDPEAKFSMRRD